MKTIIIKVEGHTYEIPAYCAVGCETYREALVNATLDGVVKKLS